MLTIDEGESTLYVNINTRESKMILRGNSFITNPQEFYKDVVLWGKQYIIPSKDIFKVEIIIGYYSTSNIQAWNSFFRTLKKNALGQIELVFIVNPNDQEDLEETIQAIIYGTGLNPQIIHSEF